MAGLRGAINTGAVALSAATAKTVAQIVAASNHRVLIPEFEVSFDGTTNTAVPVLVELVKQSDAGTSSALTPVKIGDWQETMQTTARHTATAEPTTTDVIKSFLVHPQQGEAWQAPFGAPLPVPGGTRLGWRITAPAVVNVRVNVLFEE